MKRATLFTLVLMLLGSINLLKAQRTHAIAGGVGTIYYYGDLTDGFRTNFLKPAGGMFYYRYIQPNLAFRLGMSYGEIEASDRFAEDEARRARNLSFSSPIFEVSTIMVYEIIKDKNFGNSWVSRPFITPYVFGGVSMFYFNPRANFDGTMIELQPLGTEGQFLASSNTSSYSRFQVALPGGLGINTRVSERIGLSFELGYRITLTDYLDDVSTQYPDMASLTEQNPTAARMAYRGIEPYDEFIRKYGTVRGNPDANDGFFFAMLTFNYYLSRFATPN